MEKIPGLDRNRTIVVVSIWAEVRHDPKPVWRGSIRTADGPTHYFASLAELNRLLCEIGGWVDPAGAAYTGSTAVDSR